MPANVQRLLTQALETELLGRGLLVDNEELETVANRRNVSSPGPIITSSDCPRESEERTAQRAPIISNPGVIRPLSDLSCELSEVAATQ